MTEFARYEKQLLFEPIGISGQKKLQKGRIGILGAGALGTNLANILCRSGIGEIIIADRDRVELSNLQRQMLFDEEDVGQPKALCAAKRLSKINSDVSIESFFQSISQTNFSEIFNRCNLIFDATDNFATRFLINEMCLKLGIPWVHSGVTAASGQSMLFVPGKSACFRCIIADEPASESFPTVHNSGIITSIVTIIASMSAATGIRYLVSKEIDPFLKFYDAWEHEFKKITVTPLDSCKHCRQPQLRRK